MTVVITTINTNKRYGDNYFLKPPAKDLSLSEYKNLAKRCIARFGGSYSSVLLRDEDAISYVLEKLILANHRFDQSVGTPWFTYLNQCAVWAISEWKNLQYKQGAVAPTSLNTIVKNNSSRSIELHEVIIDEKVKDPLEEINTSDSCCILAYILENSNLNDRQKKCIELHYLDGMNFTEIGKVLGLTKECIRQNVSKGLKKLEKSNVKILA